MKLSELCLVLAKATQCLVGGTQDLLHLQVFLTPDYMAIVMEFATGGDMFQLVVANRGLPEQDARWYFQQLIIAVDYCHKMVSSSAQQP